MKAANELRLSVALAIFSFIGFEPGLLAADAGLAGGMFMGHNGSTIQEFNEAHGDKVEYRYAAVRPGLPVQEGDVLFRGSKIRAAGSGVPGYVLKGQAYVFARGCPPAPYSVAGAQTSVRVVLRGAAPRRAAKSCRVIGYDSKGTNAILRFDIAE